ncbi:MAG: peptidyl-prolyl cis-trans isomerase, partial [Bacteroidales bacterium]|nr:peptidyl-prolyl cis-trans isomerase [Bacteroidales bacterium]
MNPYRAILVGITILVAFGISSCNLLNTNRVEQPVARVFDKYLYRSDLNDAIPSGTSENDSIVIARNHIETWIRNQLMFTKAEEALSDEQKNVEKKIEEYRSSLLIYSYRQKLLHQKMDTFVTNDEILAYYESNIDNFILSEEITKAIFVKVPLSAPNLSNVRSWTKSGNID